MATAVAAKKPTGVAQSAPPADSPLYGLGEKYHIDPNKLVDVLRGTVIKPDKNGRAATNEEVAAFCIVAQQYGLNPFTREIHAFVSGDKGVVPIVGIDGWTHIVNSCGQFDGCEFDEVADPEGRPVSITCKMHVRGRTHPVCATERYSECRRDTQPWRQMPWRMLRHKAYMQAARYAFGLAGIFDEDEARDIVNNTTAPAARAHINMPMAIGEVRNESTNGNGTHETDPQDATPEGSGQQFADELPTEQAKDEYGKQATAATKEELSARLLEYGLIDGKGMALIKKSGAKSLKTITVGQAIKLGELIDDVAARGVDK